MASFSGLPYLYKEGTLTKRQRAQHHKTNAKLKFQERYFQLKGEYLDYYDPKKKVSFAQLIRLKAWTSLRTFLVIVVSACKRLLPYEKGTDCGTDPVRNI